MISYSPTHKKNSQKMKKKNNGVCGFTELKSYDTIEKDTYSRLWTNHLYHPQLFFIKICITVDSLKVF